MRAGILHKRIACSKGLIKMRVGDFHKVRWGLIKSGGDIIYGPFALISVMRSHLSTLLSGQIGIYFIIGVIYFFRF